MKGICLKTLKIRSAKIFVQQTKLTSRGKINNYRIIILTSPGKFSLNKLHQDYFL